VVKDSKTLTVRLDKDFHRRLRAKLLADGTNFQRKVQKMLEDYADGPAEDRRRSRARWPSPVKPCAAMLPPAELASDRAGLGQSCRGPALSWR